jgi:hypothetical protein
MFDKKLTNLFDESIDVKNQYETVSENGAVKYSTSGNAFIDNFASIGSFRDPRAYSEVANDMELLWNVDPLKCLKLAVYIRMITRATKNDDEILEVQKGQGLKNEGILRIIWIAINHPNTFKSNISIFILAGSWKDIFTMLNLDLQYHGWNNRVLDWNFMLGVIQAGLSNKNCTNLVRKYLPTIKTNSKATTIKSQADTIIGRWIAKSLFNSKESFKEYRKLKSKGSAHKWQQLISKRLFDKIDFNSVSGRALSLLVNSKFLENQNLSNKYLEWIKNQPIAKYTGYVFELFKPCENVTQVPEYVKYTINAQFKNLLQESPSKLLVVRDTSGSMMSMVPGCKVTAFTIAKALALYFSTALTGKFKDTYAEFNDTCVLHKWKGLTPVDKYLNDTHYSIGNTNFQSVIDLFINMKMLGCTSFPEGILCISDGQFDSCGTVSNFNKAIDRLRRAGFDKEYIDNFKIILWDIPTWTSSKPKFEDFADAPNFYHLSGYDPSIISFILGTKKKSTPKNALELFESAMDQELLNRLTI